MHNYGVSGCASPTSFVESSSSHFRSLLKSQKNIQSLKLRSIYLQILILNKEVHKFQRIKTFQTKSECCHFSGFFLLFFSYSFIGSTFENLLSIFDPARLLFLGPCRTSGGWRSVRVARPTLPWQAGPETCPR